MFKGHGIPLSDEELREWGVSHRVAVLYLLLPPVGAIVVALTGLWNPFYRLLTAEDHILEWAQFTCYVVASLASGAMAFRLFREGRRSVALLWMGFALGLLLIAGEEIAWGQRVFDLETPPALERLNRQREITLHNIGNWGIVFEVISFTAALYAVGSAIWFRHLRPPRNRDLVELLVPPLFLINLFLVVLLYKLVRAVLTLAGVPPFNDFAEYNELCLAFGFASFGVLSLRRQVLRNSRTTPAGPV